MKVIMLLSSQRDLTEIVREPYIGRPDDRREFNEIIGRLIRATGIPKTDERQVSIVFQWLLDEVNHFRSSRRVLNQ